MQGLKLFIKDWQHIFKHKLARRAVGLLLLMPLVYAGFFVSGYWDPYGKLNHFPIAVVNLDKGTSMDGKSLNVGDDMVTDLKKNKDLDFHFVSKKLAEKGLKNGKYFLIISIPQDFSNKTATITEANPQKAKLNYKINQGKNFVAGQISTQVAKEVYDKVSAEITKSYTETLFSTIHKLGNGYVKAGDGAFKIYEGTTKAKQGATSLNDGANELVAGEKKLSQSTIPLSDGVEKLTNSISKIKNGSDSLTTGLDQLNSAGKKLESGLSNLVSGVTQVGTAIHSEGSMISELVKTKQDLNTQLEQYVNKNPNAKDDSNIQSIQKEVEMISQILSKMESVQILQSNGIQQIQIGQESLTKNLQLFNQNLTGAYDGSQKISSGLTQLSNGMTEWEEGFHTFSNGVKSASSGSEKLLNGTQSLASGMKDLNDGSGKLSTNLKEAANQSGSVRTNEKLYDMFSRPVDLNETIINEVPNYGTSMVPYFLTLGLFVGGLIAANVVPFVRETQIQGVTGWQHFINKVSLYSSFALIQTIIVDLIVLYGFNVHVHSVPKFMLLSLIASLTYVTCILMLVSIFGAIGKLFAVILLVTQLVTCGGTFPIELTPKFIQAINKFLPMTYAVNSFKSVINTGDWSQYWNGTIILFLFMIIFATVACSIVMKVNHKGTIVSTE